MCNIFYLKIFIAQAVVSSEVHALCNYQTKVMYNLLYRRKEVAAAAKKQWPGNKIPKFRNNQTQIEQLDQLVKNLVPKCYIPHLNFGAEAIT